MVREADTYREEDAKQKKRVDKINDFENMLYSFESSLSDAKLKDALQKSEELKKECDSVKDTLDNHSQWLETNKDKATIAEMDTKMKELNSVVHTFMNKAYSSTSPAAPSPDENANTDDVENLDC